MLWPGSVDALLEDRKVDPEVVLTNLGFGSTTDDEDYCRIPLRFLQQTSGAKGIDVDHFLEEHEDLSQLLNAWQQQQYGMSREVTPDQINDLSLILQDIATFLQESLVPGRFMDLQRIAGQLQLDLEHSQKSASPVGDNSSGKSSRKSSPEGEAHEALASYEKAKQFQNSDSSYYLLGVMQEGDDSDNADGELFHDNQEDDFDDEIHLKSWSSSSTLTVPSIYNVRLSPDESLV